MSLEESICSEVGVLHPEILQKQLAYVRSSRYFYISYFKRPLSDEVTLPKICN